uniref:NYN domain-containing protein n=1 Tax=Parascaris univalens TaxID=6257 RepID=A0A915CGZ7_PARUN
VDWSLQTSTDGAAQTAQCEVLEVTQGSFELLPAKLRINGAVNL